VLIGIDVPEESSPYMFRLGSSKTLVHFSQTTQCHITEISLHFFENLTQNRLCCVINKYKPPHTKFTNWKEEELYLRFELFEALPSSGFVCVCLLEERRI
jgi:hypothetical protein